MNIQILCVEFCRIWFKINSILVAWHAIRLMVEHFVHCSFVSSRKARLSLYNYCPYVTLHELSSIGWNYEQFTPCGNLVDYSLLNLKMISNRPNVALRTTMSVIIQAILFAH